MEVIILLILLVFVTPFAWFTFMLCGFGPGTAAILVMILYGFLGKWFYELTRKV